MKHTEIEYRTYLISEEGLRINSEEYELAKNQYESEMPDDLYYQNFLEYIKGE
jgi:hypothetical protein